MKQKKYSFFPLLILITLINFKNYYLKFNIGENFFNYLTATKNNSDFLNDLLINIIISFIFAVLIQIIINLFFKRFEIDLFFKQEKMELSKFYYSIFRFITVILLAFSLFTVFNNCSIFKTAFKAVDNIEYEKLYYEKYKSVNLIHNKNSTNYFLEQNLFVFPKPKSIIKINIDTLNQELPTSKASGELNTIIKFNVDDITLTTYATIKVQGTSTARWPKKNWSIKLFKDKARTEEIKVKIGDSIFSDKWIAKADWNDPSLLRNYLSYSLWGEIVETRETKLKYEVLNSNINNAGAQGFPRCNPVEITVNKEFYGLSLLLLGHDPDNFNIDKSNDKHLYFEFDSRGSALGFDLTKTWEKFRADGIGLWIDSYFPKDNAFTDEHKEAIDKFGKFINSNQKDFAKNFEDYLDKDNIIDLLLLYEAIYDWDALAQDTEIVTYDLKKWYLLPWDKDTTFGMSYNATGLLENTENRLLIDYSGEIPQQILWLKTYKAYTKDIEKRYAYLRDNNVLTTEKLQNLIEDLYKMIPDELWETEKQKWEPLGKVSTTETNKEQVIKWFSTRLNTLDKHFNY